jgi:hypothetical protein
MLGHEIGTWHKIIPSSRVYGFEQEPFNLPSFLTPRILALEYVRHILMVDHFLFSQHRKTITFPLPQEVGPFLVQQRTTFVVTE